jgi:hypothetical protein
MKGSWLVLGVALTLVAIGCTSQTSVEATEAEYREVYRANITAMQAVFAMYRPSDGNPGPCNADGDVEACLLQDTAALESIARFQSALSRLDVPPRYADGDRLLRAGLASLADGIDVRMAAIRTRDEAQWRAQGPAIDTGLRQIADAYAAFPQGELVPAP